MDLVDISSQTAKMGEVYPVKPLGVLAMIDEGELDWKVVCIRADDPKAKEVDDVDDVEKVFPVSHSFWGVCIERGGRGNRLYVLV